ncbi:uncharacterized protein BDR25DRAFT_347164 [Lindgomyces ingoldianus]|uniref:Uncharacterized protein n=1 Tax=Lindgomyces ingoldianus TaxID=673940 RepID=A0ACB6QA98_9PLEO|nr:uncharacterized protein BDR25DRAFT_347164 [Lindgomyces ingoldianus]KAF2463508.1 hypothetical protein BDR25DRAFT_347164 [Lindgomyces ingoldianus]
MKATYFNLLGFAFLAAANPAPRGCPKEHCYTATNECNMPYGGCWDECDSPAERLQTFTKPHCPPSAHPTKPPSWTPTPTPSCSVLSICIDAITVCANGETKGYGGCFDTCTQPTVHPPESLCPPGPATITAATTPAPSTTKKPNPSEKPCTQKDSWKCKPTEW